MSEIEIPASLTTPEPSAISAEPPDPRRWITLTIIIISAFIVVLDNTVLNVAIPTILREFHTTLASLEWVITGYALTFATLLIIGGRLGDVYGHRRVFVIGAGLFGVGSLLASISHSVGMLIVGEAIIEGIGASLMLPATLAILSGTFHGRERATAFAAWGATAGVAAASGPVVGGFLTNFYSWRWAFRINVIIAPLAIVGAMLFMRRSDRGERRIKIDLPGAALIAVGMFSLVFALSEGTIYGWITPLKDFSIAGHVVWPATRTISVIPFIFVFAIAVLVCFWFVEHAKERNHGDPLFEFAYLRFRTYRYGLLTGLILSMGQLGISFVLPVFLQDGRHISVWHNGLWVLPSGLFVIVGAQLGGRLINRFGTIQVVRGGSDDLRARSPRDAARDLVADDRVGSLPGARAVRRGYRVRARATHQRRPVGDSVRQLGRRQWRQHDRAPSGERARGRGHRIVADRADGQPRDLPHQGLGTPRRAESLCDLRGAHIGSQLCAHTRTARRECGRDPIGG